MARAVYRNADIYILDDPLSAVDAHIGALIFSQCIQEYLKDKVVLLVTHQLQYLSKGDSTIHVMDNGTVTTVGSFDELKTQFPDIVALADLDDDSDSKK